jgi:uncharacterized protein YjiS (DUF1127 family)
MSNVINSHSSHSLARPVVLSGLVAFTTVVARALRHLKHRREMNQLLALSDFQLKDIGIQRDEIQREALKSLWR